MPFSSLVLRSGLVSFAALSFLTAGVGGLTSTSYSLTTTYSGATFFDGFDFFTDSDPTNGFVKYLDRGTAQAKGLITSSDGVASYMGVDFKTFLNATSPTGRSSVRITSKASFTHGLIISDIAHMPGGICGTWPAHWTLGPNWPNGGEIDIIEGANAAAQNLMSMHTSPGCTVAGSQETGTLQTNDCDTTINYSSGCSVTSNQPSSYGTGFNTGNGGVYATQWTSDFVKIWFFPRSSIPSDITIGQPNPSLWGLPDANFQGSCNIDSKLANHNIIFDTTFCGDYAGSIWSKSSCSSQSTSCNAYVANNPSAFANAFWSINSVKVYQLVDGASSVTLSTVTATTSIFLSSNPQSSIVGPGMGSNRTNVTLTSPSYASATQAGNMANVGSFQYLGCASSTSTFSTFIQVDDSPNMSIERCTSACSGYTYAGTFNTICLCSNSLGSSSSFTSTSGPNTCSNPCPGAPSEVCGGTVSSQNRRRQISSQKSRRQMSTLTLLTIYTNKNNDNNANNTIISSAVAGVHYGSVTVSINVNLLVSVAPLNSVFGYGMGGGASIFPVYSATYISTCAICVGGQTTISTTTTLAYCGCVAGVTPINPLTTVLSGCTTCGNAVAAAPVTSTQSTKVVPAQATNVVPAQATNAVPAAQGTSVASPQGTNVAPVVAAGNVTATAGLMQFTGSAEKKTVCVEWIAGIVGLIILGAIML